MSGMSNLMAALYGVEEGSSKAYMFATYRALKQYAEGSLSGQAPSLTALDAIAADMVQLIETTRAELAATGHPIPDRCGMDAPFGGTCLLPAEHHSVHQAHVVWTEATSEVSEVSSRGASSPALSEL